ncbi:MAG: hypothetical protein AAGI01_02065 [Myxococcota bacterium]
MRAWKVRIVAITITIMGAGCAITSEASPDDAVSLQATSAEFSKNLRWGRYAEASLHVAPDYREEFLGYYEELGEDFHFVGLEVRKVDMEKAKEDQAQVTIATIEVEQEWYVEPGMVVHKERFIEEWRRERAGWILTDRVRKEEWKRRKKEEADEVLAPSPEPTDEQDVKE